MALALLALALPAPAQAVGTADGSVPIGTTILPASQLGVYGNVSIGTNFYGINAPANGAIISGNVGIGTTSPMATLDINGGTVTASAPALNIAQTWNNSGTTFDAPIKLNVTNTASHSGSLLADFQVGGTSVASISPGGYIIVSPQASPYYLLYFDGNRNISSAGSSLLDIGVNGVVVDVNNSNLDLAGNLNWQSSFSLGASNVDTGLSRLGAAKLALGNGTNGNTSGTLIAGAVGIGTTSPASQLEVATSSTNALRGVFSSQYSSDINAAVFAGRKGRGTAASPAAIANGDYSVAFAGLAYDGSAWQTPGFIGYLVNGAVSSGSVPSDFVVTTGSSGTGTERLRITSGGNVGIGSTSPVNLLDLAGSGGIHIGSGIPASTTAALYNNGGTLMWNGSAVGAGGGGSIGPGSTGYDALWTSPTAIGTGLIYENGGQVSIGTASPLSTFSVYGGAISDTLSIGTTSTNGVVLANLTTATSGVQQYSPRLHFTGQGWETGIIRQPGGRLSSRSCKPSRARGSTATGNLVWSNSVNGGGYNPLMTLTNGGNVGIRDDESTSDLQIAPRLQWHVQRLIRCQLRPLQMRQVPIHKLRSTIRGTMHFGLWYFHRRMVFQRYNRRADRVMLGTSTTAKRELETHATTG